MKKKFVTLMTVLGGGVVIFIVLTLILNNLLTEERLKVMLIDPAEQQLGRKVTIGSAGVSLLKGISINDIAIKEPDKETDFISIKAFRLRFKILPLLNRELVIKELIVDEPYARFVRKANGKLNFVDIDLKKKEAEELIPAAEDSSVETLPLTLTFDKIKINKAVFRFVDETGGLPDINSEADLAMSVWLGKTIADLKYDGDFNMLANCEYQGHQAVLQLGCKINEKLFSFGGSLTVGFEKADVNGQVANYTTIPEIEMNIDSDSIDLDKLASLKQFTTNSGDDEAVKEKSAKDGTNSPPDLKLSAKGKVRIGELTVNKMKVKDIDLKYLVKNNVVAIEKFNADIFGGKIGGEFSADISTQDPIFEGKIDSKNIKTPDIMKYLEKPADYLSGDLSAYLEFRGDGKEWQTIKNTLDGEGQFSLVDGGLHNTPITTALATLLGIEGLQDFNIDNFFGDITIRNGKVTMNSDLASQDLEAQMNGTVGLDGDVDLPIKLVLSREYSESLQNTAGFARYLADDEGRTTLYLKLKGSVQEPKMSLSSKGVKKQAGKVIEKKIAEELNRAIGSDENDPVKDMSQKLLKQLLGN
ncbi:MAG: AsmA family protein [Thermodesulfobacteriota bacterium]